MKSGRVYGFPRTTLLLNCIDLFAVVVIVIRGLRSHPLIDSDTSLIEKVLQFALTCNGTFTVLLRQVEDLRPVLHVFRMPPRSAVGATPSKFSKTSDQAATVRLLREFPHTQLLRRVQVKAFHGGDI